jgi:hypothetical protein
VVRRITAAPRKSKTERNQRHPPSGFGLASDSAQVGPITDELDEGTWSVTSGVAGRIGNGKVRLSPWVQDNQACK